MDRQDTDPATDLAEEIEVSILGPLEVRRAGVVVGLPGRRHAQLLVDLVLGQGHRISTDTLVDHLWDESPPATAVKTVQKYISELRRGLGTGRDGVIATEGAGYVLRLRPEAIDAWRFETLVSRAGRVPDRDAVELLTEAESLWRGVALDGFADHHWAGPTARRLEELKLSTSERRLGLLVSLGRHAEALPELEQLAILNPLREELSALLMMALAASGRRGEALAVFQRIRRDLAEELGIEPSSRLREVEHLVLHGDLYPAPVGIGAARRPAPTDRFPIPLSSFVGRGALLDRLGHVLHEARLVTLTGPGGSGKTRAAIEAVLRRHPDDVPDALFVDLSSIDSPDHVVSEVVSSLGLPDQPGVDPIVLLQEYFGSRPTLVVLDNCEHVRAGVADLTTTLLTSCRPLAILATSREPLGVAGELVQPVPPLALPAEPFPDGDHAAGLEESEAVQLFVTRARDTDPSFELDEANAAAVVDICTRLDGMPLALELAAAQVRAMTAADIVAHLDDRLRILDASAGGRPARQATLRATIDWSHGLLTESEQELFARISVFPGPFDLSAAAAVGLIDETEAVVGLSSLVRKSMALRADDVAGSARYRILDTLRAYGRELLEARGDYVGCRDAHARYVAGLAAGAREARLADGDRWHLTITSDYHNVRAALEYAVERDRAIAADLVYGFSRYWRRTDQVVDGLRYVERLLDVDESASELRARILCAAAELRVEHGEAVLAEKEASEALATFESTGDQEGIARATFAKGTALGNGGRYEPAVELMERALASWAATDPVLWGSGGLSLGYIELARGDYDRARTRFTEVLRWAELHSMEFLAAKARWLLGVTARHRGELTDAREMCERALAAFGDLDDRSAAAHVRMTLGDIARLDDDPELARTLYGEAYEALIDIGDRRCTASAMKNLGDLAREEDAEGAADLYLQCLERRHALGDRSGAAEALEGLADTMVMVDRVNLAAILLGRADAVRRDTGSVAPEPERARLAETRELLVARLGPDDLASAMATGSEMTLEQAIDAVRDASSV